VSTSTRSRIIRLNSIKPMPCKHESGVSIGVYGNGINQWHRDKLGRNVTADECRISMGIDWMTRKELSQSIPPAYTEWIGSRL